MSVGTLVGFVPAVSPAPRTVPGRYQDLNQDSLNKSKDD